MKTDRCLVIVAVSLLAGCSSNQGDSFTGLEKNPPVKTGISPSSHSPDIGGWVFFEVDRFDLSPEARRTLERQAAYLQQYRSVHFQVAGHADERGTREYNLALSERRASAVRDYLIALGISPARLTAVGYGKERPAILGTGELVWSQNRRTVSVRHIP